ncbi:MAG TPA: type II secretion system F family protein [bacterium]
MKTYVYVARDANGNTIKNSVEADSQHSVVETLGQEGYYVLRIYERRAFNWSPWDVVDRFTKVGLKLLTIYSRQMSLLINAGLTLSEALDTVEEQTPQRKFQQIIHKVRVDVQSGITLAQSMRKHPSAFSDFFVAMVHAGEIGGVLDKILDRIAKFYENELELRRKVQSAMVYPLLVTIVAIGISLFMLVYIVPQFAEFYKDFSGGEAQLPELTQKMMDISEEFRYNWYWYTVVPLIAFVALWKFRGTKWGHRIFDPIIIRLPIFGPLARKVAITRFSRTLGTLQESGVPLIEALEVTRDTSHNVVVSNAIDYTRERIREGETIAAPMRRTRVFPPMVTNLISVGEDAGNLEEMLYKLSDYYDVEIDATIRALASLIEPILIVIIGAIIGTIVVSLYLPIFNLVNIIG